MVGRCPEGERRYSAGSGRPSSGRGGGGTAESGYGRDATGREAGCRRRRSLSASRCAAPIPRDEQPWRNWSARWIIPWEKWTVFLHPAQRALVERNYNGPARVSGSAGTGKTIVALHRAVFLARANPDATGFADDVFRYVVECAETKLRRLISNEPRLGERLEVHSMDAIGRRLYELNFRASAQRPRK